MKYDMQPAVPRFNKRKAKEIIGCFFSPLQIVLISIHYFNGA